MTQDSGDHIPLVEGDDEPPDIELDPVPTGEFDSIEEDTDLDLIRVEFPMESRQADLTDEMGHGPDA